ncbi:MAG: SDR family oxidoreductase [bacterium]|nr:SDR family oxidoreductase [bacterium]
MKVAVVTGSAKGLGADIAKALARDGYTLVLHYHSSADDAKKLLAEIRKASPKSIMVKADVTDEDDVEKMFGEIIKRLGRVDLLVNNVGNFIFKEFGKTTNAQFRDMIESNLYSTLYTSRAILPLMRKQKSGLVINIGAVGCERLIIREMSTPYFLGKTGVYVLTKVMAAEEAQNGIRINMISPASMKADIFGKNDFPSGRPATGADVVRALMFLISPENSYINGANIEVSGGFIPGW